MFGNTVAGVLALALVSSTSAQAHPHAWIEMNSDVLLNDQGQIQGMNLIWTFGDGYAQMALDGLDSHGDGVYSQSEIEPRTKENINSLKDYDYFTVMRLNGKKLALGPVTEYGQIWSNDKLQLHF